MKLLKQIANHYDRTAVSDLSEVAGRHFVRYTEKEEWGTSRSGAPYHAKVERYSLDRALNGGFAVSLRRDLVKEVGPSSNAERELVGSREWRFVYDSCGALQLVSSTVSGPGGVRSTHELAECKEWVGDKVSWIHRFRASSLSKTIVDLFRKDADQIDPLRGLSLPSRHLR